MIKQCITSLSENYFMYCLQIPQGAARASPVSSVTTYTSRISLQPSSTIFTMAVPSAHKLLTAFSTLQPVQYLPLPASTHAPTANPEYGQYALARDAIASSCIFCISPFMAIVTSCDKNNKYDMLSKCRLIQKQPLLDQYISQKFQVILLQNKQVGKIQYIYEVHIQIYASHTIYQQPRQPQAIRSLNFNQMDKIETIIETCRSAADGLIKSMEAARDTIAQVFGQECEPYFDDLFQVWQAEKQQVMSKILMESARCQSKLTKFSWQINTEIGAKNNSNKQKSAVLNILSMNADKSTSKTRVQLTKQDLNSFSQVLFSAADFFDANLK